MFIILSFLYGFTMCLNILYYYLVCYYLPVVSCLTFYVYHFRSFYCVSAIFYYHLVYFNYILSFIISVSNVTLILNHKSTLNISNKSSQVNKYSCSTNEGSSKLLWNHLASCINKGAILNFFLIPCVWSITWIFN